MGLDVRYRMLPIGQDPDNIDCVCAHMLHAQDSDQLRKVLVSEGMCQEILWLAVRKDGLNLGLANNRVLRVKSSDVLDVVKQRFSNYNIHYFESIRELRHCLCRRYGNDTIDPHASKNLRWSMVHRKEKGHPFAIYPNRQSPLLFCGQVI